MALKNNRSIINTNHNTYVIFPEDALSTALHWWVYHLMQRPSLSRCLSVARTTHGCKAPGGRPQHHTAMSYS